MDASTVNIKMSGDVVEAMEERGINEDDVRQVLAYAGESGSKLYVEGEEHFLGKKRINNFTANIEYKIDGGEVEILNLYCHVVRLTEDN